MLKRIEKSQARPGMFIEDLEGSWNDNPFSSRRFLLEREGDVEKLKRSNISAIIINTALGLDALEKTGKPSMSKPAVRRGASMSPEERRRVALQTIAQSEAIVEQLFTDVRMGGGVSVQQVSPVARGISEVMRREPLVLINITRLKSKDETTFLHSIAVSALMVQFARYLKLDEKVVQMLGVAGLLHDIGKMKIPDVVLMKEGRLTDSEFQLIQNHPALGHSILSLQPDMPDMVLDVCLNHHEKLDGTGYPNRISGDEISLYARICTICDVYEAVTSVRPYKQPWKHADAVAWMLDRRGHFDRSLLQEFIASLGLIVRNHGDVQ